MDVEIATVDMDNALSASCDPRRFGQLARRSVPKAEVNWEQLLHTAIESSSHGLCVFDGQSRLVIGNEQHRSLYSLTSSEVSPGRSVEDVLKGRHARVLAAMKNVQLADYLAAIQRGEDFQTTYELQMGRSSSSICIPCLTVASSKGTEMSPSFVSQSSEPRRQGRS
ncbi:PAS-domain containing protein [Bradyrhizobium sp. Gha]|uniref:PAS-domain containing protein n=1 Tax=Bradyrhizobium sp. Gha TaxID=1855318 RepID=UPI0015A6BECF|nr:PAS-domain containing protein [Bradyrhizobium sp. Gha]